MYELLLKFPTTKTARTVLLLKAVIKKILTKVKIIIIELNCTAYFTIYAHTHTHIYIYIYARTL